MDEVIKLKCDGVKFDISSPKYVFNLAYEKHYLNTLEPWVTMADDWYFLITHAYDTIKSKEICKKIKRHYYPALHGLYAYFKDEME